MLTSYHTLAALAAGWDRAFRGARLADAFTQSRGECTLAFDVPGVEAGHAVPALRVVLTPEVRALFRTDAARARRNTATVLDGAIGAEVASIRLAERDRLLTLALTDGRRVLVLPFGPRPNVLLVNGDEVAEAFLRDAALRGTPAPEPRAAPDPSTADAFADRWRPRRTLAQSIAGAAPLLSGEPSEEAAHRSGLAEADPKALEPADLARVFAAVQSVRADLAQPAPRVYWRGDRATTFALLPLSYLDDDVREEPFEGDGADDALGRAVRVFAKQKLASRRYDALMGPAEKRLAVASEKSARSATAMLDELGQPSRAGRYERYGHLLMAQAAGQGPGADLLTLPDILADGDAHSQPIDIPMDPARSAVENAERYYDRARRARDARRHAEERWEAVQTRADEAADLLQRLRAQPDVASLRQFLSDEADALARHTSSGNDEGDRLPYRRFVVAGGWEVRAGRNARQNHQLTTRHAGPHDLWLHARGVPGSHVVLRRPSKTAQPPKEAVVWAARIAAQLSEARTNALVPVTVTERKYVRPVKGGPPGAMLVDREDVLDVEPGLPE